MRLPGKKFIGHYSIRTKLILLLGFVAFLALFMVSTALVINEKYNARINLVGELQSIADLLALNSGAAMMFDDEQAALENLSSLAAKPDIVIAVLYDETGKIYSKYSREAANTDEILSDSRAVHPNGREIIHQLKSKGVVDYLLKGRAHVIQPVMINGSLIGGIHLVDNMQQVKERLNSYYLVVGGSVLLTLIVVVLLSSKMQSFFSRPLFDVIHSMRKVSEEKNYAVRVKKQNDDEFGVLVDHFNEMIGEILIRDDELKSYSAGLETMVKERTHDLSAAKQELEDLVVSLEKARDEAEEASRVKSQFLANMSHEIRTPMNGVLGMTELLLGTPLSEDQLRFAGIIQNSGESLLGIINDILDFSKIEAGKLKLESIHFDLRMLIEDVCRLLASPAHKKNIELAVFIEEKTDVHLKGDPTRLRQVLINLIGNAIKFTERGEVVVSAGSIRNDDSSANLTVSISDTGVGIAPDLLENLFKPFSQADGSTTRKYGGTGLGLTISRQIVSLMGGSLECDSEPGQGTRFFFTISLERSTQEEKPVTALKSRELMGLKVMLVDDHQINLEILERQVSAFGMEYESVLRGGIGLEKLKASHRGGKSYDMVILDMDMPEMDGLEVTRRIKADPSLYRIPIIMLTSVWMQKDARTATDSGADAYLTKPVRQSDLHASILRVLGHSRSEEVFELVTQPSMAQGSRPFDLHVLVAEDNETNQAVAMGILRKLGCRVSIASNGLEAVEIFLKESPDIIFMDCQMPEMDGYQATFEIRNREKELKRKTPIVALTAHALGGDRERCLAAGMDDYLSKPFKSEELQVILGRWFSYPGQEARKSQKERLVTNLDNPSDDPALAHPPDNPDTSPVIDSKAIQTIKDLQMDGEPSLLAGVVQAFVKGVESQLSEMKTWDPGASVKELQMFAHSLKSSSANVGAMGLSRLGRALEMECRENTLSNAETHMEMITSEFIKVKAALKKEISGL
ncbi:MAG: response regulator [Desulfobacterium sp.]|jgi:signal transduction histidine kinase/DNA-binding response OmpR family regulator/HPt (histidine-containing phosphotransfer) domain-containing protein|nr:response regulator [Desulfobacterium sp.]